MKGTIQNINSNTDNAEERINELEDRNFEIVQSEDNKAKRMIRSEERLHDRSTFGCFFPRFAEKYKHGSSST